MKKFVKRWLNENQFKPIEEIIDLDDSADFESSDYEDLRIVYTSGEDSNTVDGILSVYHRIFDDDDLDIDLDFDTKFELVGTIKIEDVRSSVGLENFLYRCEKIKDFILT